MLQPSHSLPPFLPPSLLWGLELWAAGIGISYPIFLSIILSLSCSPKANPLSLTSVLGAECEDSVYVKVLLYVKHTDKRG